MKPKQKVLLLLLVAVAITGGAAWYLAQPKGNTTAETDKINNLLAEADIGGSTCS